MWLGQGIEAAREKENLSKRLAPSAPRGLAAPISPRDWPGLHCVRQLVDGEPLAGTWYDRTQEHVARRRRGEDPDPLQYTSTEVVTFSPLPCWEHLSPEEHRERVGAMVKEIEEESAAARKRIGAEPFGVAKILAQHPWTRPGKVKRSPAPLLHAASKAVRQIFYEGFTLFVAAYRTAAEKLKRGDPHPGFPLGSFPPALPFVGG